MSYRKSRSITIRLARATRATMLLADRPEQAADCLLDTNGDGTAMAGTGLTRWMREAVPTVFHRIKEINTDLATRS